MEQDLFSPKASPSTFKKGPGVRRINNVPLLIVAVIVVAFIAIVASVIAGRSGHPAALEQHKAPPRDTQQLALAIAGSQTDGVIPPAEPENQNNTPPNSLAQNAVPIALPDGALDIDHPPVPPRLQAPKATQAADPDAARIHDEKMQLFESAVRSKSGVALPELKTSRIEVVAQNSQQFSALEGGDDSTAAFKEKLAQLESARTASSSAQVLPASATSSGLSQFDNNSKSNRWALDQQVEAPPTPYTLRAGFIIPATLISGINSDLPGQIIGQVSQNVYDTATGRYLLLPQGSRLVGSYSNQVAYGQSRILVAWQRIVFPNGNTLDIGAMPGADGIGQAGFEDQVNNHYLRIFGSAILMSGITAGVALSQDQNSNSIYSQPTTSSVISQSLGQQLGTTTTQLINKNISISPTLEIRPGFRFNVMCVKDLALTKPYATSAE